MAKNNSGAKKNDIDLKSRWESAKDYLIGVYSELKKVHWPERPQLIAYTGVVVVTVAIVATIIWFFDIGLSFALEKLFEAFA